MHKTAFLFPGQGSQCAGMGQDFYENSPLAADIFDRASEILELDMKKLCCQRTVLIKILSHAFTLGSLSWE